VRAKRTPTGLTVIVANDAEPTGRCYTCGVPFYSREEGERHMGPCARSRLEEIQAERKSKRLPFMDEESWDPEVAAHMRKVGERMLAEGRMEVKPSERAGF
jgi:hypothetical protein